MSRIQRISSVAFASRMLFTAASVCVVSVLGLSPVLAEIAVSRSAFASTNASANIDDDGLESSARPSLDLPAYQLHTNADGSRSMLFAQSRSLLAANRSKVARIRVVGAGRLDANTVQTYSGIKTGDTIDDETLNQMIKRLYATGYFRDVKATNNAGIIIISVEENPVVNIVGFEGNERLSSEQLRSIASTKSRSPLSRTILAADVVAISDAYRQLGFFDLEIQPKYIDLQDGRVDVVFEINEGERGLVRDIRFVNNRAFSDGELADVIISEETAWYLFFSSNDVYAPARLQADKQALEEFYFNAGFAQFNIVSATYEKNVDSSEFSLVFVLDEGERFDVGTVVIDNRVEGLPNRELLGVLTVSEGSRFARDEIRQSLSNLVDNAQLSGFPFVIGDIIANIDADSRLAHLTFILEDGPRRTIRRIEIVGNRISSGNILRRHFPVVEGDPYNPQHTQEIRRRLLATGLYETIDVSAVPVSDTQVDLVVSVKERASSSLSLTLGFSTQDGLLGRVGWEESNLLGNGQKLGISLERTATSLNYRLDFSEPYFLGQSIGVDGSIFDETINNDDLGHYTSRDLGLSFGAIAPISDDFSIFGNYRYVQTKLTNVSTSASLSIKRSPTTSTLSAATVGLSYNTLDNPINPTSGWSITSDIQIAGLGGSKKYSKIGFDGRVYFKPFEEDSSTVFDASLRLGAVAPFGGYSTSIPDRFTVGGSDFGGFSTGGIGPRDSVSGDPLGGKRLAVLGATATIPLGSANIFKGIVFGRVGSVWDIPEVSEFDASGNTLLGVQKGFGYRASLGVGLIISTPIAPVTITYAWPIRKAPHDKIEQFSIGFGTSF